MVVSTRGLCIILFMYGEQESFCIIILIRGAIYNNPDSLGYV